MSGYSDRLRFDSIVVLESLAAHEQKTGAWLCDHILRPWERENPSYRVLFNRVSGRQDFIAALDAATTQLLRAGRLPILHIEAHGEKDSGLRLSSGETIAWEDLRSRLTEMNRLSRFNLLVVMAMCEGWWLSRTLTPEQPAPAWGVLGPVIGVWDNDLKHAMGTFYTELLRTSDLRGALDTVNEMKPITHWVYQLETAEILFCKVFRHYVETSSPERLRDRENQLVAALTHRAGGNILAAMHAREYARKRLSDHREAFAYYRRIMLMLDEIPENEERFQLTYDACTRRPLSDQDLAVS